MRAGAIAAAHHMENMHRTALSNSHACDGGHAPGRSELLYLSPGSGGAPDGGGAAAQAHLASAAAGSTNLTKSVHTRLMEVIQRQAGARLHAWSARPAGLWGAPPLFAGCSSHNCLWAQVTLSSSTTTNTTTSSSTERPWP